MKVEPGMFIWIGCEVKPGPFSDELLVKVSSANGREWIGFAPLSALREPVEKGHTAIKALVVSVQGDRFDARPVGSPLATSIFEDDLTRAELIA
jgi:hypothetical protein